MKKEVIAVGDTIEKAVRMGCTLLEAEETEVTYEVLEQPVKKTFGLFGGKPAKVRVMLLKKRPVELASDYILEVIREMGVQDAEVTIREETEEASELNLSGSNISLVIGHRGETLDALQYLACLVANTEKEGYHRISLNVGDFREKRKEALTQLGHRLGMKSLRTGKPFVLEPMNPYDRQILHASVMEIEGVTSWSDGKDRRRHVVIAPEDSQQARQAKRRLEQEAKRAAEQAEAAASQTAE